MVFKKIRKSHVDWRDFLCGTPASDYIFQKDAYVLAESVDASLLVVRQDYTSSYDINDAIDTLKNSSSKFLGCVLNDMSERVHPYGYGYGKYGYGKYGYGKYGYGERRSSEKHGRSHE